MLLLLLLFLSQQFISGNYVCIYSLSFLAIKRALSGDDASQMHDAGVRGTPDLSDAQKLVFK